MKTLIKIKAGKDAQKEPLVWAILFQFDQKVNGQHIFTICPALK